MTWRASNIFKVPLPRSHHRSIQSESLLLKSFPVALMCRQDKNHCHRWPSHSSPSGTAPTDHPQLLGSPSRIRTMVTSSLMDSPDLVGLMVPGHFTSAVIRVLNTAFTRFPSGYVILSLQVSGSHLTALWNHWGLWSTKSGPHPTPNQSQPHPPPQPPVWDPGMHAVKSSRDWDQYPGACRPQGQHTLLL